MNHDQSVKSATGQKIAVSGTLTAEGVECQALREDKSNTLYTLVPAEKLKGYKANDHVSVRGTVDDLSFCQQGITITVESIKK